MIVAIDGPAGVGKSAAARGLARRLGFVFLDTGALYRAITWKAVQLGIALEDTDALLEAWRACRVDLSGSGTEFRVTIDGRDISDEIRRPEIEEKVRIIARVPEIRQAITELQKTFARGKDIVAEGRDTSTVVFPEAEVKFYLDADLEVRVRRRKLQREASGLPADEDALRSGIAVRDHGDKNREIAPLRRAEDGVLIDTSRLSLEEVIEAMTERVNQVRASG